jgi:4a-hydroxytetrahydrobiopterin dehydratase
MVSRDRFSYWRAIYGRERPIALGEVSMTKLTIEELKAALKRLPDWQLVKDREAITRKFQFVDFDAAFAFMTRSALLAAKMDHHPEWFNVYSKVDVTLATHDAGGVTQKDIDLATAMDGYAAMGGGR